MKNITPKIGSKVKFSIFRYNYQKYIGKDNLQGVVENIDGAYHTIRVVNNFNYDRVELYPNEFKLI